MDLAKRIATATELKAMTLCPECRRSILPIRTPNGCECPACGTTWQPRRSGLLHVLRGGRPS